MNVAYLGTILRGTNPTVSATVLCNLSLRVSVWFMVQGAIALTIGSVLRGTILNYIILLVNIAVSQANSITNKMT